MPPPDGDTGLQSCPNCSALIDTSEQEPLAKFHCPLCGTSMRAARRFNQFTILETLGSGGMGAVYKARDGNLNRLVAIKLLRKEMNADAGFIAKLEEEARITASINHPNVVKVFSFGSDHGQYYIAMELVDKGSLDDLMQLQNRVAELQVMQVGLQIASGLQAAHERGLIHRDVKPGNILFADAHTAKITDFGLALLTAKEAENRGEIWGTPYYIAPEKLNNEPEDFRSDIYSLGGTLFHAVAGRPPFEAADASLVALKHLKSRAVSLQAFAPDVASETAYVVNRMLNKDPKQRYASYAELIEHLKYAIDTLSARSGKPRTPKQRQSAETEGQNQAAGILTLLMLAGLLAAGGLAFAFRAKLFGNQASAAALAAVAAPAPAVHQEPAAILADSLAGPERAYEEARQEILRGQYATAQDNLSTLLQTPTLAQPLKQWALLHLGLADLLDDQLSEARSVFGRLSGDATSGGPDAFFAGTAQLLTSSQPLNAAIIPSLPQAPGAAFALFLFGLKDWELGDFAGADAFFEAYLAAKPAPPDAWTADYQPIARKYRSDYAVYAPVEALRRAGKERAGALHAAFAKARAQLQVTGRLVDAITAEESGLAPTQATPAPSLATPPPLALAQRAPEPTPAAAPAATDPDAPLWQRARQTFSALAAAYRFDEAAAALQQAHFTAPATVQARDALLERAKRLVAFQRGLIADMDARGGFPQAVSTRLQANYPQGFASANADGVQASTPYGALTVPWADLTPETLLAMARYFADTPEKRANAAAFALEMGRTREAQAFGAQLAPPPAPVEQQQPPPAANQPPPPASATPPPQIGPPPLTPPPYQ
jgi:tRNA A-37 threonylcarbamoyl transferase component Bud32